MLARTHHKAKGKQEQALTVVNELWETEVVPQLPADLEAQAKKLKAFQRQRQVANAYDLLRAILGYVLGGLSSRQWGAWAVIIGLADISDRGWSKRLQKSGAWLLWLFGELTTKVGAEEPFKEGIVEKIMAIVLGTHHFFNLNVDNSWFGLFYHGGKSTRCLAQNIGVFIS